MKWQWLIPAAYAAAHLAWFPQAHNTHAVMYALLSELPGRNSLEFFHPLYVPILSLIAAVKRGLGISGNSLLLFQLLSLAGALWHLSLVYSIAEKLLKDKKPALFAVVLATGSINLWAWSLQTMPYTWATALMLLCARDLLETPNLSGAKVSRLGLWTGLSAGFDTAGLALAPAVLLEIVLSEERASRLKLALRYLGAGLAALAASYLPWILMGRELPSGFGQMISRLPSDIPSYQTRSLGAQLAGFQGSTAPVDVPWGLLGLFCAWAALTAWRRGDLAEVQRRAMRVGGVLFAGILAFFLVNDPHSRFLYAAGLLFPVQMVLFLSWKRLPASLALLAWAGLLAKNAARPADYLPERNPGFDEAGFVAKGLGGRDLLVCLSQPDWLFAYAFAGRAPMVRPDWAEEAGPGLGEAALPPARLPGRVRETLCAGGRAWLAADALFRNSGIPPKLLELRLGELLVSFEKEFSLVEPLVSPWGQHYYPLALKKAGKACAP